MVCVAKVVAFLLLCFIVVFQYRTYHVCTLNICLLSFTKGFIYILRKLYILFQNISRFRTFHRTFHFCHDLSICSWNTLLYFWIFCFHPFHLFPEFVNPRRKFSLFQNISHYSRILCTPSTILYPFSRIFFLLHRIFHPVEEYFTLSQNINESQTITKSFTLFPENFTHFVPVQQKGKYIILKGFKHS